MLEVSFHSGCPRGEKMPEGSGQGLPLCPDGGDEELGAQYSCGGNTDVVEGNGESG